MKNRRILTIMFFLIGTTLLPSTQLFAHCDAMDGPVVKAAQKALERGNVNLVLIWVQEQDETEIRKVFNRTLAVRKLSPEARELADMYFFETLVRIHRAGEGAPYTGLKPAGRDFGPAIPAVDKAVEGGAVEPLLSFVTDAVRQGIQEKFEQIMAQKNFSMNDVEAGREFVKNYVIFMHYIKGIYDASVGTVEGHFVESTAVERHPE